MSAAGFYARTFKPGGDPYVSTPWDAINTLPDFWRTAAHEVACALMSLAREEGNFNPTSAEIAARLPSNRGQAPDSPPGHRCLSFVQKGLYALHVLLGILGRKRAGGRRLLDWIRGLKPSRDPGPASAPPAPPSEEERRDTTTREGPSSSSRESSGEGREGPDPAEVQPLYELARRVLTDATFSRVAAAVAVFGAAWVGQALRMLEKRNRKPGNLRKPLGFMLGVLKNWQKEGGPPDEAPEPAPPAARKAAASDDEAVEKAREQRLREAWGLLSEPEREAIRAAVLAGMVPALARRESFVEAACLEELGRRQAAEEPRAP